jgi:hypothetical protein
VYNAIYCEGNRVSSYCDCLAVNLFNYFAPAVSSFVLVSLIHFHIAIRSAHVQSVQQKSITGWENVQTRIAAKLTIILFLRDTPKCHDFLPRLISDGMQTRTAVGYRIFVLMTAMINPNVPTLSLCNSRHLGFILFWNINMHCKKNCVLNNRELSSTL